MDTIPAISCKECHSTNTTRAMRKTFLQRVVLKALGFHPWKCLTCKHRFFSRNRGQRRQPGRATPVR